MINFNLMDMRLTSLTSGLEIASVQGNLDIPVKSLSISSAEVEPGAAFFCLKGAKTDGHLFADQAVSAGAVAVFTERNLDLPFSVTQILVPDTRAALADVAVKYYGYPSREMKIVGVTGTNGKTTTCFFLESIFKSADMKSGLIGTIEIHIGSEMRQVTHTTPEPLHLQGLMREMTDQGVEALAMEVSSHAIEQSRVRACDFDVVAFTNLSQDHLDYHGDMVNYLSAKRKLFDGNEPFGGDRVAVINVDDAAGRKIAESIELRTIGVGKREGDLKASIVELGPDGSRSVFDGLGFQSECINIPLPGDFNVMNALTAAAAAHSLGIGIDSIKAGIERLGSVPGRFERVDGGKAFAVVVDYAHSPDSLEKTLRSARVLAAERVISVFGCGGDRDKEKRPLMGKVSSRLADFTIITSDNPRSEDPEAILDQIEGGVVAGGGKYKRLVDRREAIGEAISMAGSGDFVVIAGKGHERGQIFGDRVVSFDDRDVAREVISGVKIAN